MDSTWKAILEGNLDSLFQTEKELLTLPPHSEPEHPEKLHYTRLMISFYRQDLESMKALIQADTKLLQANTNLHLLSQLRWLHRSNSSDLTLVNESIEKLRGSGNGWRAEGLFIAAGIYQNQKQYFQSEQLYREASAFFETAGMLRKSLRASLSSLAAFSCLKPESRLFPEYLGLYRKALTHAEPLTAAVALVNISREFQKLGGLGLSLDYANQATSLLEQAAFGSREFGLCLVHRAHILLDLKRMPLAKTDLMHALTLPNQEVQSAIRVLSEKFNLNLKSLSASAIAPTWKERQDEKAPRPAIGKLEEKIIFLLSQKPCTKFELMDDLYGQAIDLQSRENRFKNLMSRLRSRFPDLIFFDDGLYHLMEASGESA